MKQPKNENSAADSSVESTALLGCPFCGVIPEYEAQVKCENTGYYWPHQIVHNCKVIGHQICVRVPAWTPDTKDAVFSIWNTRAAGRPNDKLTYGADQNQPKG